MRKIIPIFFSALLFFPVILYSQGAGREEMRAVWIHSGMFDREKSGAVIRMRDLLDQYAGIGINNLFCFNSLMSQHQKEWDFLEVLIEEAHRREIKVHPIFCPGHQVSLTGEIHENPEWLITGMQGEMYPHLNIAHPGVRQYFVNMVNEALEYDIDGIHLDYIRFPVNQRFSYDYATCEAFREEFGYSPVEVAHDCGSMIWCEWIRWNAKQVTALVRDIKQTIEKSDKDLVLGADVFPDHRAATILIGQNWEQWANEGIIDFVCPMLYTNDPDLFRQYVETAVKTANGRCLVYPGIACRSSHNTNTPEGVVKEVEISRKAGADGVVFFSGYSLTEEFLNSLKEGAFK